VPFSELVDQTGLADAWLAGDQYDTERTPTGQGQLLVQRSDLGVPAVRGGRSGMPDELRRVG
jgi:hypothetical protein